MSAPTGMDFEVRLYNRPANTWKVLPKYTSVEYTDIFSDVPTGKLVLPGNAPNFSALVDDVEIVLQSGSLELGRFLYEDIDGNEVDVSEGGAPQSFTGRGEISVLERALWFPTNWPTAQSTDDVVFGASTIGKIMRIGIQQAQGRGTIPEVTIASFSDTTDSAGNTWPDSLDISFKVGQSMLTTLQNLRDMGFVEFRMVNRALQLYANTKMGIDRTAATPYVILRRGRDISQAPRKGSTRDIKTLSIISGDDNRVWQINNTPAIGTWGQREVYYTQSGVSNPTILQQLAQDQLTEVGQKKVEKTQQLTFNTKGPLPFKNYTNGDWIWTDVGNGLEKYRVMQITLTRDGQSGMSGSVVLNDSFAEWEIQAQRAIESLLGGRAPITGPPTVQDNTVKPNPPTTVIGSSSAYTLPDGSITASATLSWTQPTAKVDGTPLTDISQYLIKWIYHSLILWQYVYVPAGTSGYIAPIDPLLGSIDVQVATIRSNGIASDWSSLVNVPLATDSTAPITPSTPTVTSAIAGVRIVWDGKDNTGQPMVKDFDHCEVHASTVSGFTPSAATQVDSLDIAGTSYYNFRTYGTTVFVKLVAVDTTGNKSPASGQGSAAPIQAADADIGNLSAGKITTGSLLADITVSARIKTADTGARVELNAAGIKIYDSTNTLETNLQPGASTFQGTINASTINGGTVIGGRIQTASSGRRVELNNPIYGPYSMTSFTGDASEQVPAQFYSDVFGSGTTRVARTVIRPPDLVTSLVGPGLYLLGTVANGQPPVFNLTSGNIQVYCTDSTTANQGTLFYHASGSHQMQSTFGLAVTVLAGQSSGYTTVFASAFTVSSTKLQKKNIKTIDTGQALDEIRRLRPVHYDRKLSSEHYPENHPDRKRTHRSVVAEELREVIPDAVPHGIDGEGTPGVDVMHLLATTIAAVQALDTQVQEMEKK